MAKWGLVSKCARDARVFPQGVKRWGMPNRPKKVKKDKSADGAKSQARTLQTEAQRRMEMSTRSTLSRFQNRSSDRK
jgi:hypothetical protein